MGAGVTTGKDTCSQYRLLALLLTYIPSNLDGPSICGSSNLSHISYQKTGVWLEPLIEVSWDLSP